MSRQNNLAFRTMMLINNDRKQGIKGALVAHNGINGASGNVISIASYLKRVAFFGGFAS